MRYFSIWCMLLGVAGAQAAELKLVLSGDGMKGNLVSVGIYGSAHATQFPADGAYDRGITEVAKTDELTLTVSDLPLGRYAIAVFVDANRNGKLDTNLIGIPKEAYGFSNDARGRFGPPRFEEAAFTLSEGGATQSIHMH